MVQLETAADRNHKLAFLLLATLRDYLPTGGPVASPGGTSRGRDMNLDSQIT